MNRTNNQKVETKSISAKFGHFSHVTSGSPLPVTVAFKPSNKDDGMTYLELGLDWKAASLTVSGHEMTFISAGVDDGFMRHQFEMPSKVALKIPGDFARQQLIMACRFIADTLELEGHKLARASKPIDCSIRTVPISDDCFDGDTYAPLHLDVPHVKALEQATS